MTTLCETTGSTSRFGDYKSTRDRRIKGKVPDVAIMDHNNLLRIVGELKPPWIEQTRS